MALTLLRLARDRPGAEHTARLQARAGRSAAHVRAVERAGLKLTVAARPHDSGDFTGIERWRIWLLPPARYR